MSVYVGSKGNHGVAPTFGSQQTVQASLSRPPKKKWTAIGWFFLWGIAALVVLGIYAANNTELGDVPGLLFFLTVVMGAISSVLHYEHAKRYNDTIYAEEIRRWNNSYICDRCLTVFEEQLQPHVQVELGIRYEIGADVAAKSKRFAAIPFALAVLCFFLPFISLSCGGEKRASFSGIELVTGTTRQQPALFGPLIKQKLNPEPLAVVAFLSVLAAALLSFAKSPGAALGSAIGGGLSAVFLFLMKIRLDNKAINETAGNVQVNAEVGFVMEVLFVVLASAWSCYLFSKHRGPSRDPMQPHAPADREPNAASGGT